jgi:hypothetical protein
VVVRGPWGDMATNLKAWQFSLARKIGYLDPYYRFDPYTAVSSCRTVPVSGLMQVDTAVLWYGPEPYVRCKVYGRSRIWYGRHPYAEQAISPQRVSTDVGVTTTSAEDLRDDRGV